MSNSSLVDYTKLSPCHSGTRTHSIDRITPHCVVGQASVEGLGSLFSQSSRQVSCNYGIGADGRVGLYVDEKNRSWCSSSNANDQRAVTIECASDATEPYAFKDVVYQKLITLCVDICKRNGKTKLIWFGDKDKTLNYTPKSNEMVLTVHRWFANKSCPGAWMYSRMGDLASKVTAQLETTGSSATSTPAPTTSKTTFKQGDVVSITEKTYYDGKSIPSWVLKKNWIVKSVNGNRVVIDKSEDGKNAICSAIKATDLKLVSSRKSVDEIAREVINGKWGNGTERKSKLTAAGYDYNAVQKRVNELMKK